MSTARRTIRFVLNGRPVAAEISTHYNLIELLQQSFDLFGARESCGQGLCGCCTVLVDGKAVSGCLQLAAFIDGKEVVTIESFARGQQLTPVQEAFIECGAFQCGFCTPGFVMQATAFLQAHPDAGEQEIREALSGNICRCTGYQSIIDGVLLAAERARQS